MSRILFIKKTLEMLSSGVVFKRVYGIILRTAAVLTAAAGAVLWIVTWQRIPELGRYGRYYSLPPNAVPAAVVVQVLLLILIYAAVHTLWIRARTVEKLPETGYIIAPIFSVTLKLVGELLAWLLVFSGFAGGFSIWIAGRDILRLLGLNSFILYRVSPLGMAGFVAGLATIIMCLFLAFVTLVGFYYSAELAVALVDIAGNTRGLRRDQNLAADGETAASEAGE